MNFYKEFEPKLLVKKNKTCYYKNIIISLDIITGIFFQAGTLYCNKIYDDR